MNSAEASVPRGCVVARVRTGATLESADRDTILVVDDHREFASALSQFLEQEGYRVLAAHTGEEGLRILRQTPIAIALIDLVLPDMRGVALMGAARRLDAPPDVIILTGHATTDSAIMAVEDGAAGYIVKPVDFTRLAELIGKLSERRRLMRENVRLSAEVAERRKETDALLAISRAIVSAPDVPAALQTICGDLAHLMGGDAVLAYLHQRESDRLRAVVTYQVPQQHLRTVSTTALPLEKEGRYLPIWETRRPVHSDDVGTDPRLNLLSRLIPHQSGLLLPLVLHGAVAGAIYLVWWTERRRVTARELELMESVCGQVALLLRTAEATGKKPA